MNLLVAPLTWLSTHLVFLTLSAFAVAGYWLFGTVGGQQAQGWLSSTGESERVELPLHDQPSPATMTTLDGGIPGPAAGELRDESAPGHAVASGPAPAAPAPASPSPPRLIGGTLPVYPLAGHDRRDSELIGQAFRPPSSGQLPEASQDPRERLVQAARRAFWNNEYDASEAAYMALITRYPGDADAFGELGNLYQTMAAHDRALDAYYEAGVRLKLAGEFEKLRIVREILLKAQDSRASELGPG